MKKIKYNHNRIYQVLYFFAFSILIMAILAPDRASLFDGYLKILLESSNLLTDYMKIGGISAAFFNAFTILIYSIITTRIANKYISGPELSAIILVTGFAFFGKNIYNSFPLSIGVYLYAIITKTPFKAIVLQSLYITALAPLVSEITFSFGLNLYISIPLSYFIGILIGLISTPLSSSFLKFHQGYSLYNLGFTAGIIAMLAVALVRMFGFEINSVSILYEGSDTSIKIYLILIFSAFIIFGFIKNGWSFKNYNKLLKSSGRLPSDYITAFGIYPTLINMGIMGFISMLYVFYVGGKFNGPVVGGILSVCAFSSFGKHPFNSLPIFIGIILASYLNIHEPSSTSSILAGLFGTTLSPISGEFGIISGIIAGFFHMAMVFNVGYLHGGANLYNNGFAGGFVAAILVPILERIREIKKEYYE